MGGEDLIEEDLPFDSSERSEEELIDHLFGFKAGTAGERRTRSSERGVRAPASARGDPRVRAAAG